MNAAVEIARQLPHSEHLHSARTLYCTSGPLNDGEVPRIGASRCLTRQTRPSALDSVPKNSLKRALFSSMVWYVSAMRVRTDQPILLKKEDYPWVGRGALKLLGALEPFGVTCTNDVCADFGSSTGGFTQVLLHHGAKKSMRSM